MTAARSVLRAMLACCLVLSAGTVVSGYAAYTPPPESNADIGGEANASASPGTTAVGSQPIEGLTVVTTDSNRLLSTFGDDSRADAELVAYDRNGTTRYYNDSHDRYWDVDPVRRDGHDTASVDYVASDRRNASACGLEAMNESGEGTNVCARNVIERANLSTGTTTTLYDAVGPRAELDPWNDADRLNATHYVVADRSENRVFVVDTRTGEHTWEWYASAAVPFDSGGSYLTDWTHMNDVEALPDGRIMVSLRNQNQVVFLDPDRAPAHALIDDWTLGASGNDSILHEPYNPDYIPRSNGGPAVLVADSENNRVVEYARTENASSGAQRTDGEAANGTWTRSWEWTDDRLQWPRDADRLPNGHTLITDSNGDRVLEVNRSGGIVWNASVGLPYDAERLGTGPESTDGPSIQRPGAPVAETDRAAGNADSPAGASDDPLAGTIKAVVPNPALSALLYVSPAWIGIVELFATGVAVVVCLGWIALELRWRSVVRTLRAWADER